jgi:plastocyanin
MKHLSSLSGSTQRSPRAPVLLLGLAIVVFALAGCSGSAAQQPTAQPAGASVAAPAAAPAQASNETATISVKNYAFNPKELTVSPGTTVVWHNDDSVRHTVTSDTGLFDGNLPGGADFQFTFSQPGTYPYYCKPHGGPGEQGMSGIIVVK